MQESRHWMWGKVSAGEFQPSFINEFEPFVYIVFTSAFQATLTKIATNNSFKFLFRYQEITKSIPKVFPFLTCKSQMPFGSVKMCEVMRTSSFPVIFRKSLSLLELMIVLLETVGWCWAYSFLER